MDFVTTLLPGATSPSDRCCCRACLLQSTRGFAREPSAEHSCPLARDDWRDSSLGRMSAQGAPHRATLRWKVRHYIQGGTKVADTPLLLAGKPIVQREPSYPAWEMVRETTERTQASQAFAAAAKRAASSRSKTEREARGGGWCRGNASRSPRALELQRSREARSWEGLGPLRKRLQEGTEADRSSAPSRGTWTCERLRS